LIFTPDEIVNGKRPESLLFGIGTTGLLKSDIEKYMRQSAELDDQFSYIIDDLSADTFSWSFRLPAFGQVGISKHQKVGDVIHSVSYQARVGSAEDEMLDVWTAIIRASDLSIDQPTPP
jgi:hypothetical protein